MLIFGRAGGGSVPGKTIYSPLKGWELIPVIHVKENIRVLGFKKKISTIFCSI